MTYYWQTSMHLAQTDRWVLLQHCPELGICKQTTTLRKGYRVVEKLYFFAGESGDDDPNYTFAEILAEAEYRKALREIDAIESSESFAGTVGERKS